MEVSKLLDGVLEKDITESSYQWRYLKMRRLSEVSPSEVSQGMSALKDAAMIRT